MIDFCAAHPHRSTKTGCPQLPRPNASPKQSWRHVQTASQLGNTIELLHCHDETSYVLEGHRGSGSPRRRRKLGGAIAQDQWAFGLMCVGPTRTSDVQSCLMTSHEREGHLVRTASIQSGGSRAFLLGPSGHYCHEKSVGGSPGEALQVAAVDAVDPTELCRGSYRVQSRNPPLAQLQHHNGRSPQRRAPRRSRQENPRSFLSRPWPCPSADQGRVCACVTWRL
jgi:hypothetical protein